ncbi:uncharacterized protein BCR38DRAFT_484642 [Pseudomassariella vexata]|uniref:BZIP domain-containing protein n=1 Tax=Pseudomassariella vexata TaxID=1141098 RepID=A0A1Y2E1G3_9PEZI|nr:uncharacterized protein BCR38DRAFT_484642 [Pseudomassariella vexata]ORY65184.1 hypothetical protein BCR38DRAFT_484642 [Pseudomassariella vexata]
MDSLRGQLASQQQPNSYADDSGIDLSSFDWDLPCAQQQQLQQEESLLDFEALQAFVENGHLDEALGITTTEASQHVETQPGYSVNSPATGQPTFENIQLASQGLKFPPVNPPTTGGLTFENTEPAGQGLTFPPITSPAIGGPIYEDIQPASRGLTFPPVRHPDSLGCALPRPQLSDSQQPVTVTATPAGAQSTDQADEAGLNTNLTIMERHDKFLVEQAAEQKDIQAEIDRANATAKRPYPAKKPEAAKSLPTLVKKNRSRSSSSTQTMTRAGIARKKGRAAPTQVPWILIDQETMSLDEVEQAKQVNNQLAEVNQSRIRERNNASAARSRARKRQELMDLEDKVETLEAELEEARRLGGGSQAVQQAQLQQAQRQLQQLQQQHLQNNEQINRLTQAVSRQQQLEADAERLAEELQAMTLDRNRWKSIVDDIKKRFQVKEQAE